MARVLVLLCLSTCILKAGYSLRWEGELRSRFVNCSGQEVTFPWRFTLEEGDNLVGISWSRHPLEAGAVTTIGTFAFENFDPKDDRISQVNRAGIKLSDIRHSDSGTYVVNIRLSGSRALITHNTSLLVAEPPQTTSGKLEVAVNSLPVVDTTQSGVASRRMRSSDGTDRLYCGEFTHLGVPPVSVVWETPDGRILPSTGYEAGYFVLALPAERGGGNYHCLLNLSSTAVGCLPPDAALRDKGTVEVVLPPPSSVGASMSGGVIAAIVIVVVILIAVVIIVFVFVVLRRRKGKSYAPKEPDSPGPEEEDDARHPFKDV